MSDPYRRKILEELAGPLDPSLFEECALDLIRPELPVVPIRGGDDAGMDGAVADGLGEPFPMVVTTAQDVIGNFTRNLKTYVEKGGPRRRVVLATSTSLTPRRQRHLIARARELGFTLVQLYEQEAIADRLYENSRWARELLGLTGRLRPLSSVPRTHRILREIEFVGRDEDLDWLEATSGDRMIVGQPGSGKTHLLVRWVRQGAALFLADGDREAIGEALMDLRPQAVIVDDAHADPGRLVELRRIRDEIVPDFDIVATTWPGGADEVAAALALQDPQRRRDLELLTRAEILEILQRLGVTLDDFDRYMDLLVGEASNKPGLAVVLASLWLQGQFHELLSGEGLRRTWIPALKRLLGTDPTLLLACYASGGSRGQTLDAVADFLGESRQSVWNQTRGASQGGVISVSRDGDRVSVPSELLRTALIREVFYPVGGPRPGDLGRLIRSAPQPDAAAEALVLALGHGAGVPRDFVQDVLRTCESPWPWSLYAQTGEDAAAWVLQEFPGDVMDVLPSVLRTTPDSTLRRLLRDASSSKGLGDPQLPGPHRILREWLSEIPDPRVYPSPGNEPMNRRRRLVQVALQEMEAGRCDSGSSLRACLWALSPKLEGSRDSVLRNKVQFQEGLLRTKAGPEILDLWNAIRPHLEGLIAEAWTTLDDVLHQWAYPSMIGKRVSSERREQYREVARSMVRDLVALAAGRPGLASALEGWTERLELPDLELIVDLDFRVLFPGDAKGGAGDLAEAMKQQEQEAEALAFRWAARPIAETVDRLLDFERQSKVYLRNAKGWHTCMRFHSILADRVEDPVAWLATFLDAGFDPQWLWALEERVARQGDPEALDLLERGLEDDRYSWGFAVAVLSSPEVADAVLQQALDRVPSHLVVTATLRGQVPVRTLMRLLEHPDADVAVGAAAGEWEAEPRGEIRVSRAAWRAAILRWGSDSTRAGRLDGLVEHAVKGIFQAEPDLALEWLLRRIAGQDSIGGFSRTGLEAAAIRSLDKSRRKTVLADLAQSLWTDRIVRLLVADEPDLYEFLLGRGNLRRHHLEPLAGRVPDGQWRDLAGMALDAGYDPREVAKIAFFPSALGLSIAGSKVLHWTRWKDAFLELSRAAEGRLREVAEHGLRIADEHIEKAQDEERRRDLHGGW